MEVFYFAKPPFVILIIARCATSLKALFFTELFVLHFIPKS